MIGGPEMYRIIHEFEAALDVQKYGSAAKQSLTRHHEETTAFQADFKKHVLSLTKVIEDSGNPFMEESKDLLVLQNKDIVDPSVHESLMKLESIGLDQFNTFVNERLVLRTKSFSFPVKRNKMPLMSCPKPKKKSRCSQQISNLKSDCSLFSRLYIACQTRSGQLEDFFMHENQPCPPSLSSLGKMRSTAKSSLFEYLEDLALPTDGVPEVDTFIIDGAAAIHMIRPGAAKTYVFLPYVQKQLQQVSYRLDIVWDVYIPDSLKNSTRESRGKGRRRRVGSETTIPTNWSSFLRVDANKTELFNFLAYQVVTIESGKQIVTTRGPNVLTNHPIDICGLTPCNHEEADTKMIVHLTHAARYHKKVLLRTVDTDVVALAVAAVHSLEMEELWVALGTGRHLRYIAIHEVAHALGPSKSKCLPMFHSLTGCDTVSSFNGIGKKKAWQVWSLFEDITNCFLRLSTAPSEISVADMALVERCVVLLFDKTSNDLDVNSARKYLFTKKGRQIEHVPPTSAALLQHVKRAVYQGGHIWGQASLPAPDLPDPSNWGWEQVNGQWQPFWTHLPQASKSCQELLKCGCTKGCKVNCKCVKPGLKCIAICFCNGDCGIDRSESEGDARN
eukprot:TRINITY_DN21914_c0_g2_i3.p1 TRINITY_DN21914_c0_g2~~TRINITY_DN21914_c0_g2_i3.p1  ORF type:complete len:617 (-),score=120.53 TRINITY_DN21914_c0_g2_i3:145-1995(-)